MRAADRAHELRRRRGRAVADGAARPAGGRHALAVLGALALVVPARASLADPPTARRPAVVRLGAAPAVVRLGMAPAVPRGARRLGPARPTGRVALTFVLAPRDPRGLAALAREVSDPASPGFRHYLPRGGFARRFGPTRATLRDAEAALRADGLVPSGTGPDGRSIRVVTTVAAAERALHTQITRYGLGDRARAIANVAAPALPAALAPHVLAVLGLDTIPTSSPATLTRLRRAGAAVASAAPAARGAAVGPAPVTSCADAARAAGYTADQLAGAYGFDGAYVAGDLGAGVSVGVVAFAPVVTSDIATYASCYGLAYPSISVVPVDGGATGNDPSSTVEAELDVEDLVGLAPQVHLVVYEGTDSGDGVSGNAAYDTYATAVNADAVRVLSTSWGGCEPSVGAGAAQAEDVLFEQAALQGQTVVAAAGDGGSEDCYGTTRGAGGTSLAVDDPASQPYVTGVGGTTLDVGGSPAESVWNTTLGVSTPGAGGGGVSGLWAMPGYQANAAPALGVRGRLSACGPGVAAGARAPVAGAATPGGTCREVPDVAANAGAPYAIYCTVGVPADCASGGWTGLGGTSAAAPTWAALFALADSSAACATSGPVGFANPALYAIASRHYAQDFRDVLVGSNDLTGTNPGDFQARPGYDLASGLGTPVASGPGGGLVADLCAAPARRASLGQLPLPSVTAVAPHTIRARPGVHVTITGTNFSGATAVRFGAAAAQSFTVRTRTTIAAVAPDGSGTVHVTVTTRAGTSARGSSDAFEYLVRPVLFRVAPPTGPARGRAVVLVGAHLDGAVAVMFGARRAARFTVRSPTRIVAVAPPGRGSVLVSVRTRGGTSARLASDRFTYTGVP